MLVLPLGGAQVETVRRFGGSTAPGVPWPEDPLDIGDEDRLEKLEPRPAVHWFPGWGGYTQCQVNRTAKGFKS